MAQPTAHRSTAGRAAAKFAGITANFWWVLEALVAIELPFKLPIPIPVFGVWPIMLFGIDGIKKGMGWVFDKGTGASTLVEFILIGLVTLLALGLGKAAQAGGKSKMGFMEALLIWPPIIAPLFLDFWWAAIFILVFTVAIGLGVTVLTKTVDTGLKMAPSLLMFTVGIWLVVWLSAAAVNWAGSGEFYLFKVDVGAKNAQQDQTDQAWYNIRKEKENQTVPMPAMPPGLSKLPAPVLQALSQFCLTGKMPELPAGVILGVGLSAEDIKTYMIQVCKAQGGQSNTAPGTPGNLAAPPVSNGIQPGTGFTTPVPNTVQTPTPSPKTTATPDCTKLKGPGWVWSVVGSVGRCQDRR